MLNYQRVSTNVTKRRSLCDWLIFWGAQQADAFTWRATGRGVCTSGRAQEEFAGFIKTLDGLMLFANHVMLVIWVICLTLYLCKSCGRGYINHVFKNITHVKCVDICDINVKALYTSIHQYIYIYSIYIDEHICYVCCMYNRVTLLLSLLVLLLLSLLLLLVIIVITGIIVTIIYI